MSRLTIESKESTLVHQHLYKTKVLSDSFKAPFYKKTETRY
jgi:hypothetical protein